MSDAQAQTQPRVLIVDDSRMVRATISKHIRGRFDVREEGDGEAGWHTLMLDPTVQVVISDLSMPKLDGYGLLARIRNSRIARIREVPVIIISGDEDEAARNHAKECGATDFITKGIGTVELLSRLDALVMLAQTSRELEASREALASNVIVDPVSGLPTEEYLKQQGRQALSLAQRHGGEISVIVVEIDRYEELVARHGQNVGDQLVTQFRSLLVNRMRQEDTVSQTSPKQFTVVCPGTSMDEARAFAGRLEQLIRNAKIRYRGEQVTIGLKFGFANSRDDDWQSMTNLLDLAEGRTDRDDAMTTPAGAAEIAQPEPPLREAAEPEAEPEPSPAGAPAEAAADIADISVEEALALLRSGEEERVKPLVAHLARRLFPLLRLIDQELRLGMHVEDAEAKLHRLH